MEDNKIDIDSMFDMAHAEVFNRTIIDDTLEARNIRMTQVISKFASALTARLINVSMSTSNENPHHQGHTYAWSDAENIWFNKDAVKDLTNLDTVLAVKGMALHEIGHILYTPRSSSNLFKWVKGNGYLLAFNMLEDQRLELFLDAKYSNVKHWFSALVTKAILDNPEQIPYIYPIIHGRTFLPAELRMLIKQEYHDQSIIADIARIVDDYTVLNLSNSAHIPIAMKLVEELHKLLQLNTNTPKTPPNSPRPNGSSPSQPIFGECGHPGAKSSEKSKTTNKAGQDILVNKILERRKQQGNLPDGEQEAEGDIESPNTPPDSPGRSPGQDGNQSGKPDKDGDPGNSAGTGKSSRVIDSATKHLNRTKDLLRNELTDLVSQFNGDEVLNSKHVATPLPPTNPRTVDVPADVVLQVRSFTNQLMLLKADYDPGWNRKVDTGRLNVQRYSTGVDADECFDQWDHGRDDVTDIETVILLDTSGSMSWTIDQAYDSTWAIKRSLDKLNASTTVVTFDNDARVLYSANERAGAKKKISSDSGGTEPHHAIAYAKYLLANSDRAIKILIVITDGEWWNAEECDKTIAQLRRSGVITSLGYIDYHAQYSAENGNDRKTRINGHNAEIVVPLDGGSSLLTLAKALVKVGIKRNLAR